MTTGREKSPKINCTGTKMDSARPDRPDEARAAGSSRSEYARRKVLLFVETDDELLFESLQ
jgi:hypothetical protein